MYRSCVRKVKQLLPKECIQSKQWGSRVAGQTCVNPDKVCARLKSKSRKKYIVVSGQRRLVHTGSKGGRYVIVKGKKRYLSTLSKK